MKTVHNPHIFIAVSKLQMEPVIGSSINQAVKDAIALVELTGASAVSLQFNSAKLEIKKGMEVIEVMKEYWRDMGYGHGCQRVR